MNKQYRTSALGFGAVARTNGSRPLHIQVSCITRADALNGAPGAQKTAVSAGSSAPFPKQEATKAFALLLLPA